MLRIPLRARSLPLKGTASGTSRSVASNVAFRRAFTSQPNKKAPTGFWWKGLSPMAILRGTTRYGAKQTAEGVKQGVFGGSTRRGFRFSAWRGKDGAAPKIDENLSLSGRLKKLSKEYGWSAVGVYLGLSVLDFPFCFLFVKVVGAERIGQAEQFVVSRVRAVIPESVRNKIYDTWQSLKRAETETLGDDDISDTVEMAGWGVGKAEERNKEEASLATQLALAYAIHKSFIFIRVPLTAAITPKIVKTLRSWGWNIGKRVPR